MLQNHECSQACSPRPLTPNVPWLSHQHSSNIIALPPASRPHYERMQRDPLMRPPLYNMISLHVYGDTHLQQQPSRLLTSRRHVCLCSAGDVWIVVWGFLVIHSALRKAPLRLGVHRPMVSITVACPCPRERTDGNGHVGTAR